MKEFNFRSNGKLLLTGEYAVLHGAEALVLPVTYGQRLSATACNKSNEPVIHWYAMARGLNWFTVQFNSRNFHPMAYSDKAIACRLSSELMQARKLNPGFVFNEQAWQIDTNLEFNQDWGWGSSSTHISNLASWANINPFDLHFGVSNGSGYDVAAAREQSPFVYSLINGEPNISRTGYFPSFHDKLYFVYTGRKQNTNASIARIQTQKPSGTFINRITEITNLCYRTRNIEDFQELMNEHELLVADYLKRNTVQQEEFKDYRYTIKSLGAWGGDFVLFVHNDTRKTLIEYLKSKNIDTWFTYKDIVLQTRII